MSSGFTPDLIRRPPAAATQGSHRVALEISIPTSETSFRK